MGEHLDANLWCPFQGCQVLSFELRGVPSGNPRGIGYFDAIRCYDRGLGKHFACRQITVQ